MLKRKTNTSHDSQSKRHRSIKVSNETPIDGTLIIKNMEMKLLEKKDAVSEMKLDEHLLRFTSSVKLESKESVEEFFSNLKVDIEECFPKSNVSQINESTLSVDDVIVKLQMNEGAEAKSKKGKLLKQLLISWTFDDEAIGSRVLEYLTPSRDTE